MTGSHTATVETLTAEVRVLMVGSRQVTLSVYRQLDTVPYRELEAFGRVRDRNDSELWVVGKERSTGILSRAEVREPWHNVKPPREWFHTLQHWEQMGIIGRYGSINVSVMYDGLEVKWPRRAVTSEFTSYCALRGNDTRACLVSAKAEWEPYAEEAAEVLRPQQIDLDEAKRLPLIVLAGLR